MNRPPPLRPLIWVGASRKDFQRFSEDLRHDLGYQLYLVQSGRPAPGEKPLGQGLLKGLGVRELVADDADGTYRVVYTVRLRGAVYVLHAFNKKSKHGIATPRHELEVIRSRYALAIRIDEEAAAG